MKLTYMIVFLVMAATVLCAEAKKKKKGKSNKKPPQWRPSAMPVKNKPFLIVDKGESVSFDCKAKGKPKPQTKWFFNEQRLAKDENTVIKKSGEVILENVTPARAGNYSCIVENSLGTLEWTYILKVNEKRVDILMQGPRNVTALAGNRAKFTCLVLNDPAAKIQWYKGKVEARNFIESGDEKEILVIEDLTKDDEGVYGCQASNLWTLKTKEAYLQVIEPRPPAKTTDDAVTVVPWRTDIFGLYSTPNTRNVDDLDSMYITTKKPRNRNGNKKNRKNRKKDRKNKKNKNQPKFDFENPERFDNTDNFDNFDSTYDFGTNPNNDNFDNRDSFDNPDSFDRHNNKDNFKNFDESDGFNFDETDMSLMTTPGPTGRPWNTPTRSAPHDQSSTLIVWEFDKDKVNGHGGRDGNSMNKDTRLNSFDEDGSQASQGDKKSGGSINSWVIYTIVGAVGGVVLLMGLVAITLTVCCNKEDGGVYKSTSV